MKGREGRKVTTTCTYHYTVGTYARTREQGDKPWADRLYYCLHYRVQFPCDRWTNSSSPPSFSPFPFPFPFAGED